MIQKERYFVSLDCLVGGIDPLDVVMSMVCEGTQIVHSRTDLGSWCVIVDVLVPPPDDDYEGGFGAEVDQLWPD